MKRPALLALSAALTYTASACECGVPHAINLPGETAPAGTITASVRQEYLAANSRYDGVHRQENPAGEFIATSRTSLLVSVGVTHEFSIFVAPQFLSRQYRALHDGDIESGRTSGFGDMPFGVNYYDCLIHGEKAHLHLGLSAAASAPFGSTSKLREEVDHLTHHHGHSHGPTGAVHGHDLALGTGSWGGIFGGRLVFEYEDWILEANAHYVLRTKGDYGYKYADSIGWGLLGGARVARTEYGVASLLISVTGAHSGDDEIEGTVYEKAGHDLIYAGPAVRFESAYGVTVDARVELPVYVRTGDSHMIASWRGQIGVTVAF